MQAGCDLGCRVVHWLVGVPGLCAGLTRSPQAKQDSESEAHSRYPSQYTPGMTKKLSCVHIFASQELILFDFVFASFLEPSCLSCQQGTIPAAFLWDKLGAAKPFRLPLNSLQLLVHVIIACTSYQQTCYQQLESITFSIDHSI